MNELRIEQQPSLIGIEQIPSKLKVEYDLSHNFKIKSEFARVYIDSALPRVHIDQQKLREAIGYYKPASFTKAQRQENQEKGQEKLNQISKEANLLAAIANKGKPNPKLIRDKVLVDKPELNTDLGFLPKNKADINFELGWVDVKASKGYLEVISKPNFPQIDYQIGDVQVYLRQKGYVEIEYIGNKIDFLV